MTTLTVDYINTLTYNELRSECKKADLDTTGKKAQLQERLLDHVQDQKNNDNGRKSENKENTSPEVASASKKVDEDDSKEDNDNKTPVNQVYNIKGNVRIIGTCGEINNGDDAAKNGHYNQLLELYGEVQKENAKLRLEADKVPLLQQENENLTGKVSALTGINDMLWKQLIETKMQLEATGVEN